MTRFVHITDLHVSHPDSGDPGLHSDTPARLKRVVEIVNAMEARPDFLIASGDLTNRGDEESYRLVKSTLAALEVPTILALGNHDKRPGFHEVFGEGPSDRPYYHQAVIAGLHVITLDTSIPDRVSGRICDEQFDFLKQALAAEPDAPKLLVMHHPPRVDPDGLPWGSIDMASTERLGEMIAGRPVIGILSGHIHINQVNHWHGVPILVASGQHSTVDLLERRDLKIVEGGGLGLCVWRPTGLSVSFVPLAPQSEEIGVIDRARLLKFS